MGAYFIYCNKMLKYKKNLITNAFGRIVEISYKVFITNRLRTTNKIFYPSIPY